MVNEISAGSRNPDRKSVQAIAEAASEAFWAKVVEMVPEAVSGDFAPDQTMAWEKACVQAVRGWISNNARLAPRHVQEGDRLNVAWFYDDELGYGKKGESRYPFDVLDVTGVERGPERTTFHVDHRTGPLETDVEGAPSISIANDIPVSVLYPDNNEDWFF